MTTPLLVEMLQTLWRKRQTIRHQLEETMPAIIDQASSAADRIAADVTHSL